MDAQELSECVDDSITNQLDELSGGEFQSLEELYDAYKQEQKMIKELDLHILQTEMAQAEPDYEAEMSMVEKLSEELGEKEDKIIALENDIQLLKDSKKAFMKYTLMVAIRDENETCEFIDGGHETLPIDRREWLEILLDMNENDWNEDGCSELYFDGNSIIFRQKTCVECDCTDDLLLIPNGAYYICKDCKCCNPKCYSGQGFNGRGRGWGNNPQPLWTEGKCCNDCNDLVIMERMKQR